LISIAETSNRRFTDKIVGKSLFIVKIYSLQKQINLHSAVIDRRSPCSGVAGYERKGDMASKLKQQISSTIDEDADRASTFHHR
jgi:hypothetical protein